MVVVATGKWGHNMEVQEVHIVEVLAPMRNLCDSPNYSGKNYHMVNSSIGFHSLSWTYIHLDSLGFQAESVVPQVVDPWYQCVH